MKRRIDKKLLIHRFIWAIILLINIALFIFSFLNIKWLQIFHGYTIGLAFGIFAPVFYILFGLLCLEKVLHLKKINFRFFRPSSFKIATLSISIVLLTLVAIYIHSELIFQPFDSKIWTTTFDNWWATFTKSSAGVDSLLPNSNHYGLLTLFVFIFISWIATLWAVLGLTIFLIIFELYILFAPTNWVPHWLTNYFWSKVLVKIFLHFDKESKVKFKKSKKELSYQFAVNKKAQILSDDEDELDARGSDFSADTYNEEVGNLSEDMMYSGAGIMEDPLKNTNDFLKTYDRSKKNKEIKAEDLPFDDPF